MPKLEKIDFLRFFREENISSLLFLAKSIGTTKDRNFTCNYLVRHHSIKEYIGVPSILLATQ